MLLKKKLKCRVLFNKNHSLNVRIDYDRYDVVIYKQNWEIKRNFLLINWRKDWKLILLKLHSGRYTGQFMKQEAYAAYCTMRRAIEEGLNSKAKTLDIAKKLVYNPSDKAMDLAVINAACGKLLEHGPDRDPFIRTDHIRRKPKQQEKIRVNACLVNRLLITDESILLSINRYLDNYNAVRAAQYAKNGMLTQTFWQIIKDDINEEDHPYIYQVYGPDQK